MTKNLSQPALNATDPLFAKEVHFDFYRGGTFVFCDQEKEWSLSGLKTLQEIYQATSTGVFG